MSVLGWFIAVCGVAGVVFALRMMLKMKKMQTVPFHAPSELARGGANLADAKGMVSTEGEAVAAEALVAPMSGQPCLAYEIVVERKWETHEETENGSEKKAGKDKIFTEYRGSRFHLTDASGAVEVDVSKEPEADFERSHESSIKVGLKIPGTLEFGQMQINTPSLSREGRTVAFVATERVVKPGSMYAIGAFKDGAIGKPDGLLGKLTLSSKGREGLLGKTRRNMILGYSIGGPLAVAGALLGVFGPAPAPSNGCKSLSGATACDGKITSKDGSDLAWTVAAEDRFRITVSQPNVKRPIDATVTVTDAAGKKIAFNDDAGNGTTNAVIEQRFAPGVYRITVADYGKRTIKGGFSFKLDVQRVEEPRPRAATAAANGLCQQAAQCCIALKGSPASCNAYLNVPEATCQSALSGYRRAAKRNRAARAVCMP